MEKHHSYKVKIAGSIPAHPTKDYHRCYLGPLSGILEHDPIDICYCFTNGKKLAPPFLVGL